MTEWLLLMDLLFRCQGLPAEVIVYHPAHTEVIAIERLAYQAKPDHTVDWLFPLVWDGDRPLGRLHRANDIDIGEAPGCRFAIDGGAASNDGDLLVSNTIHAGGFEL